MFLFVSAEQPARKAINICTDVHIGEGRASIEGEADELGCFFAIL